MSTEAKHSDKRRWFERRERPYYYEADVPADYTEHGVEKGAKFDPAAIDNADVVRVFTQTQPLNLDQTFSWLEKHRDELDPSTVVVDTDDGNALKEQYGALKPRFIVSKRALNRVRHLNTLLNRANETLDDDGYLWCHCRTAVLKKKLMFKHHTKIVAYPLYCCHYIWHRMFPKIRATKWLYFGLTHGRNRTYNRVEVLGRMYRAGFEVVDEGFRRGEYYVLAHKAKAPIWDDEPTCSPLIKLRRVGKDGRLIGVYKFRTMYSYSEYLQPYIYQHNHLDKGGKFADDYRVNMWGTLFRKLWLDELPMIINVIKGDMKLVGVRPLSRHYFSLYTPEMQQLRTRVKPGLLPPFYYDKTSPKTLDDVQASERRYLEAYLENPFATDWRYFWGTVGNIMFRGKRSK